MTFSSTPRSTAGPYGGQALEVGELRPFRTAAELAGEDAPSGWGNPEGVADRSDAAGGVVEDARQVRAEQSDGDDDDDRDERDHQAVLDGGGAALGEARLELGEVLRHWRTPIPGGE